MVWTLRAPGWGVRVRPLLREEIDAAYRRCHDLASAGKNAEALQCWPTVIRQVRTTDPLWVPAWLAEQTLLTLSNKPDWKEAKEVLPRLIEQIQAAGMGQPATAEFFTGVGLDFRHRGSEGQDRREGHLRS